MNENLHQVDKTLRHRYRRSLSKEVFERSKNNLKYCCSFCKFTINDVDRFVEHSCKKPSSKQFKCKFCTKVFTNMENILFHKNLHVAEHSQVPTISLLKISRVVK